MAEAAIKKAYRSKSLEFHPDKCEGDKAGCFGFWGLFWVHVGRRVPRCFLLFPVSPVHTDVTFTSWGEVEIIEVKCLQVTFFCG